jgi:hypothetical protein
VSLYRLVINNKIPMILHPGSPVYSMYFRRKPTPLKTSDAGLPTKHDIPYLFFQLAQLVSRSQDSTQEFFQHIISPYPGVSWTEFQFCCLRIRCISQGVVCFHSVGLGGSWTFMVTFFDDSRVSTLFVSLYVSLA